MLPLNRQEVYDKVARHLLTQKVKSHAFDDQGGASCAYRSDDRSNDGKRISCAIGCLIPDNYYDPKMEGVVVSSLFTEYPNLLALFDFSVEPLFLQALQNIHDGNSVKLWKQALTDFAAIYHLDAEVLKEFPDDPV